MQPTRQLIDQLERDDIEQARQMTFAQKFMAGAELFEYACDISRAGIRMQHPEFDEQQVEAELRRRIHIGEPRD
jgi:hypothetical protein